MRRAAADERRNHPVALPAQAPMNECGVGIRLDGQMA
jgi:hypothetical protein